ncbi:MAG TPA: NADH-quinone oxidoreductase subunit M, partial [Calditrichaeota bacterium]|nr:NADH-quinone oxidoreductase subunit M [Calditrichota bacterium]
MGLLSLATFFPLLGMFIILFIPKKNLLAIKIVAAVVTFIPLVITSYLWMHYDYAMAGINLKDQYQFVEQYAWIPAYNIEFFIGVDGLSFPMLWLTTLLNFLAIFASWNIARAQKGYFALFLLLATSMMGVFVSLDFFLFYVFW